MSHFQFEAFQALMQQITQRIDDQPLNPELEQQLNAQFPANGEIFNAIKQSCLSGIEAGALCQHSAAGIKYGRVIKPTPELNGFSVDVVEMQDVVGPHHRHPLGEIDLIMPLDENAQFDQHGAGWLVYGPDSAHCPTVTQGKALVLYLLPEGVIEFTRNQ